MSAQTLSASVHLLISSLHFLSRAECSDLQDESVFVLPLDLLERSSHEEKTRAAIERFGLVSLSAPGS